MIKYDTKCRHHRSRIDTLESLAMLERHRHHRKKLIFPWRLRYFETTGNAIADSSSQTMALPQFLPNVSLVFCETPLIQDDLQTVTSQSQQTTLEDVLPYILGSAGGPHKLNSNGFPKLKRDAHVKFLRKTLEKMSGAYTAMDAARPWILYWTLTALSLLGQDVSVYRDRHATSNTIDPS